MSTTHGCKFALLREFNVQRREETHAFGFRLRLPSVQFGDGASASDVTVIFHSIRLCSGCGDKSHSGGHSWTLHVYLIADVKEFSGFTIKGIQECMYKVYLQPKLISSLVCSPQPSLPKLPCPPSQGRAHSVEQILIWRA